MSILKLRMFRFQDAVKLAMFHMSLALIGNTFTLSAEENINTNNDIALESTSALLALLSR